MDYAQFCVFDIHEFHFDEKSQILKINTKHDADNFYRDNVRSVIVNFVKLIRKIQPKKVILDVRNLQYAYPLALYAWVAQHYYQCFSEIGLEKFACVTPNNFMTYLSFEQVMDEIIIHNPQFEIHFFRHHIQAENWCGLQNDYIQVLEYV